LFLIHKDAEFIWTKLDFNKGGSMEKQYRIRVTAMLAVVMMMVGVFTTSAQADEWPKEVDLEVNYLFVPTGFDDNDETLVVLDGYLPSACHRLANPLVTVDPVTKRIVVSPRAKEFKGVCPDVVVPFTQEVRLGQLATGNYEVVTKNAKHREQLSVSRSKGPGPDDYLYAPVDRARVVYPQANQWVAVLEGRFTNTCLGIEETKVQLIGKTIMVQPIMNFIVPEEPGTPCKPIERPFRTTVVLPYLPQEGRYLLHVRSLNGQAVNEAFFRATPQP